MQFLDRVRAVSEDGAASLWSAVVHRGMSEGAWRDGRRSIKPEKAEIFT